MNFINSQGRLAETAGEGEIWRDLRMKLYIDPDSLKAKYASSPEFLKPYLPETACRVDQIYQARHGLPVRVCSSTPATGNPSAGIGLRRAMPLLRFAAYGEQHKWAYVAALAAVIGLPLALGYSIGHRHGKGSR